VEDEGDDAGAVAGFDYDCCFVGDCAVEGDVGG